MPQASEKIFTLRGEFSRDPLLYDVCMIKIWSTLINLKFGDKVDEELLYYLDNIDRAVSDIKERVIQLLLEKPEKLSN